MVSSIVLSVLDSSSNLERRGFVDPDWVTKDHRRFDQSTRSRAHSRFSTPAFFTELRRDGSPCVGRDRGEGSPSLRVPRPTLTLLKLLKMNGSRRAFLSRMTKNVLIIIGDGTMSVFAAAPHLSPLLSSVPRFALGHDAAPFYPHTLAVTADRAPQRHWHARRAQCRT